MKLESSQPRTLRFRSHYKIYILAFVFLSSLVISYWSMRFSTNGTHSFWESYSHELFLTGLYFLTTLSFYFFWLRSKLNRSIQVFDHQLTIRSGSQSEEIKFSDIDSMGVVCWSIFYVKTQSGQKHYFHSSIERVDYIWEGIYLSRPDLVSKNEFENFRVKLVQYDHHQKRKEWFFKHKMVDVLNWGVLPFMVISLAFIFQSEEVIIHHQGVYFFRLFMYVMLVLLSTSFFYSILLKKFIFDKKVAAQMEESQSKIRDLEFEGMILQRSKISQVMTACLALALLIKMDVNLYSIAKVKEDIASFKMKKGKTILVDNRYNCVGCKYRLNDGDYVVFGRGTIGQVLAKEGDMVGQISQDSTGRMIASQNVQEVPRGHLAIKAGNGKDIVFVKIDELIGKIQN